MAGTVCFARLLLVAAMATTLVCACRQDSHRDDGPLPATATGDAAALQPLATEVDSTHVESLDDGQRATRSQVGIALAGDPRTPHAHPPDGVLQPSPDDSSRSRHEADAANSSQAWTPAPIEVTGNVDRPMPAAEAPAFGVTGRAGAATAASARFAGLGIGLLAVALLVGMAWLALRRTRRDDGPEGGRAIGWDQPRLPAGATRLDSPRASGCFLDVTTTLEEPGAPVAFYPAEATLRHDPVRTADGRAKALSSRVDDAVELTSTSPYAVTSVAVRPMASYATTLRRPADEDGVATAHAVEDDTDVGTPDDVANDIESSGNGWSDLVDAHPAADAAVSFVPASTPVAPGPDTSDRVTGSAAHAAQTAEVAPIVANTPLVAAEADAAPPPLLWLDSEPPIRTGEAWARAGHYWWRLAWHDERGDASALEHAAEAFERALALEPERAAVLGRMLSRCHRALASLSTGDAREHHLEAALSTLDTHFDEPTVDDDTRREWAGLLLERAQAEGAGDRASLLDRAERLVGATAEAAGDVEALRLQARIALVRSARVHGGERSALEDAAVEALLRGIAQGPDAARDECLAELIEVERVRMARMNGAALVAHGQRVQAALAPRLAVATSIEPLLAWLRLLGDWAGRLRGEAARRKLAEAEPLFRAIEALAPDARNGVRFARAYYLRLRARNEVGSARIATLREGLRELCAMEAGASGYPVALEAAQMHLAVAEAIGGRDARADYIRAVTLAREAVDDTANAAAALACALTAQLALAETAPVDATAREAMNAWSSRLLALTPGHADALRLQARVLLLDRDPQAASERCAAAWDAGADGLLLLPVWRRASDEWAQAANTEPDRAAWRHNRQHFRTASSSLP